MLLCEGRQGAYASGAALMHAPARQSAPAPQTSHDSRVAKIDGLEDRLVGVVPVPSCCGSLPGGRRSVTQAPSAPKPPSRAGGVRAAPRQRGGRDQQRVGGQASQVQYRAAGCLLEPVRQLSTGVRGWQEGLCCARNAVCAAIHLFLRGVERVPAAAPVHTPSFKTLALRSETAWPRSWATWSATCRCVQAWQRPPASANAGAPRDQSP